MNSYHKNIDPNETAQFDSLAEQWWDPSGPMKMLHKINQVRFKFITNNSHLNKKRILDVGCGAGLLTEPMAKTGGQVTGIDMSQAVIVTAKQHAKQQDLSIHYQQQTIEDLANAKKPPSFDIITCMELLEHVPDPESIIQHCAQCLTLGGHLFISTLNRHLKSYLFAIIGAEYILRMLPKGTHHYNKFIKPSELARSANRFHLTVTQINGMNYSPLSKQFTLTQDVSINYILCLTKPI